VTNTVTDADMHAVAIIAVLWVFGLALVLFNHRRTGFSSPPNPSETNVSPPSVGPSPSEPRT